MKHTAKETGVEESWYLLEDRQVFSQSILWDIQQQYYGGTGVNIWRWGEVPHYITNNPTIASGYAEIVFAFLCDQRRLAAGAGQNDEPLYVCELGAGAGRFAYIFLKQLTRLCEQAGLPPTSFRYVLTDFTQRNLDFWRTHPRFQPFLESGVLEMALFDIKKSDRLVLQLSGETITAGSLKRPLAVIANYLLDSVPQDLFYIDGQRCDQCLVSLVVDKEPETLTTAELLGRLRYRYDYQPLAEPPYQETYLRRLLAGYRHKLTDAHLLFPAAALRCLQRLKALSREGMLLLSADKGDHRLESFQGLRPPVLVGHTGCFSLSVNFHALNAYCEQGGGVALFPTSRHNSLEISGLLMVGEADGYVETRRAFQRHAQDFTVDDFYTITTHAGEYIADMSLKDILAYLRLGHHDSYQFSRYSPRLKELAPELDREERQAVGDAIDKVWELYFPLGEESDLAYEAGCLLYEMDDYARALTYFERSIEIYGEHAGTLFNMAACHQMIGQSAEAEALLRKVLEHDPDNQQARASLAGAEEAVSRRQS